MELNVHPLLVHFPIAFLAGYTLLEFVRIPILTRQSFYFYTKAILLFFGVVMAAPAILTGLIAQRYVTNHALVDLHQNINILATAVFGILAVGYFILWVQKTPPVFLQKMAMWSWIVKLAQFIVQTPVVFILTLIGIILLTIGGALGGIIVYGANMDPFTAFIAALLGIK